MRAGGLQHPHSEGERGYARPPFIGNSEVLFIGNIEKMAETMHLVLSDRALRDNLVRKGLARAKYFSWDKAAFATLMMLTEMYDRRKRA